MHDFSKTFFSSKRAESFRAELQALGIEAIIVSERDYLSQWHHVLCEMEPP